MENYFDGNNLVINEDKTQVMIIKNQFKKGKNTKNSNTNNDNILINNNIIENKEQIKVLGTYLHNSLMFNYNFEQSKNSIHTQLKVRENTIKNIKKYLNPKMTKIIAN